MNFRNLSLIVVTLLTTTILLSACTQKPIDALAAALWSVGFASYLCGWLIEEIFNL